MKKRLLSALLLLALLLSLTVPVSAVDLNYKDKDEITYKEAVAVLSREGIINGFEDGTFRPKETLTRSQACTILTKILGGWPDGAADFIDVRPNAWYAGYVAYCSYNEIVAGYGDGTFNPDGKLTGTAWSKMLLTALGYDAVESGMQGSGWATNVASLASVEQLYNGIANFDPSQPVTRDEACQIAYNAMYDGQIPEPANDILYHLSYSFSNTFGAFNYPNPYRIPMEIFRLIYGDEIKAEKMYEKFGNWGGNCYGMVSTAGILYQYGNGISPSDFNNKVAVPGGLSVSDRSRSLSLSLTQFIEALHVSQLTEELNAVKAANSDDLGGLVAAVKDARESGKAPVLVCVWGPDGGHAIMGYDVEEISSSEARVLVYDPNYPMDYCYITLSKSGGSYTGWSYPISDDRIWSSSNGSMSYIPYADYYQGWQNRKGSVITSDMLFMTVSDDATIYDEYGNRVASVRNGSVTVYQEDAYAMRSVGILLDADGLPSTETTIWLPGHSYSVKHTGYGEFTVELTEKSQTASVTTTASSVGMNVEDSSALRTVRIPASEQGASYSIDVRSSLEEDDGAASIRLSGTVSGSGVTAGSDGGSLVIDGADPSRDTLYVDGSPVYDNGGTTLSISSIQALFAFAADVNAGEDYAGKQVVLTSDLTLNADLLDGWMQPGGGNHIAWTPIGSLDHPFRGVFDGGGHTVSGLYADGEELEFQGLFGVIDGATVRNVTVADSWFNVGAHAGPVVGYAKNGSVIDGCTGDGNGVRTHDRSGGIVGWTDRSDVYNCEAFGVLYSGRCCGGVVGDVYSNGKIYNCSAAGSITGGSLVCGITGGSTGADIQNCICTADVEGYLIVGGAGSRTASYSYALQTEYINNGRSLGYGGDTMGTFDENAALSAPVTVNGVSCSTALGALNAWVEANAGGDVRYRRWQQSGGYPYLAE